MSVLARLQECVRRKDYYLSAHAEEEMWADGLEHQDVVHAILNGKIERKLTEDVRGTRYRIAGPARNGRPVRVVVRFNSNAELLIITAYAL